jgi:hypothetical protein
LTEGDWKACHDPEPMVRALPAECVQRELRLFAASCVRRVWHLLSDGCRAAVEASEKFAEGQIDEAALADAVAIADREAQAIWPGSQSPDSRGYAASAAVDASSVWPRTAANVLAATSCAASAAGCAVAEENEARYDESFEAAREAELAAQAELLRGFITYPAA